LKQSPSAATSREKKTITLTQLGFFKATSLRDDSKARLPGNSTYLDATKQLFKVGDVFESTDRKLAGKYFKLTGFQMRNGFKEGICDKDVYMDLSHTFMRKEATQFAKAIGAASLYLAGRKSFAVSTVVLFCQTERFLFAFLVREFK